MFTLIWSPSWENVPGSASTPLARLQIAVWGFAMACTPGHNLILSSVCTQKCSSGLILTFTMLFLSPYKSQDFLDLQVEGAGRSWPGPGALKDSKTHPISYLKCCLTCCACQQAQNAGSVQAGQKQVRGLILLSCF